MADQADHFAEFLEWIEAHGGKAFRRRVTVEEVAVLIPDEFEGDLYEKEIALRLSERRLWDFRVTRMSDIGGREKKWVIDQMAQEAQDAGAYD